MILGLVGRIGEGKTIGMVALADLFQKVTGLEVYSNNWIQFSHQFKTYARLKKITDSIICIDELHEEADSRDFKKNIDITKWLLQIRKRRNVLLYTTQSLDQIDKRFRNQTHFLVFCRQLDNSKFELTLIDTLDYLQDNYSNMSILTLNGKSYFNKYKTFEIIEKLN